MRIDQPFHEGEMRAQRLAGEDHIAERNAAAVGDAIMPSALGFLPIQRMAVFGTADADAALWASIVFGSQGFMTAEDGKTVKFRLDKMIVDEADPFWKNVESPAQTGMLAIELETRRRLRINGTMVRRGFEWMRMDVAESFPNCPKYIQRRVMRLGDGDSGRRSGILGSGSGFDKTVRAVLEGADTLFVATAHPERGADVSHRGGVPGFAKITGDRTIRIPDFRGNSMFQTFGNLQIDKRAGVVVPDFAGRQMLQLTGNAEVLWSEEDATNETGGTSRFLTFDVTRWQILSMPLQAEWEFLDASPLNPSGGNPG